MPGLPELPGVLFPEQLGTLGGGRGREVSVESAGVGVQSMESGGEVSGSVKGAVVWEEPFLSYGSSAETFVVNIKE